LITGYAHVFVPVFVVNCALLSHLLIVWINNAKYVNMKDAGLK